ncbi:hypothetical protein ACWDWS_07015, partial [Streptomyces sp. NPDC003328]
SGNGGSGNSGGSGNGGSGNSGGSGNGGSGNSGGSGNGGSGNSGGSGSSGGSSTGGDQTSPDGNNAVPQDQGSSALTDTGFSTPADKGEGKELADTGAGETTILLVGAATMIAGGIGFRVLPRLVSGRGGTVA